MNPSSEIRKAMSNIREYGQYRQISHSLFPPAAFVSSNIVTGEHVSDTTHNRDKKISRSDLDFLSKNSEPFDKPVSLKVVVIKDERYPLRQKHIDKYRKYFPKLEVVTEYQDFEISTPTLILKDYFNMSKSAFSKISKLVPLMKKYNIKLTSLVNYRVNCAALAQGPYSWLYTVHNQNIDHSYGTAVLYSGISNSDKCWLTIPNILTFDIKEFDNIEDFQQLNICSIAPCSNCGVVNNHQIMYQNNSESGLGKYWVILLVFIFLVLIVMFFVL